MKTMTCIVCPMGCRLTVDSGEVSGHRCNRGRDWALAEVTNPVRVLTTTVALEGGELELLPVRTLAPVPKAKLRDCLRHANRLRVKAPVRLGQVICPDLAGTGVQLTAARSVAKI